MNAFLRGLHATLKTADQDLALTYEIANSYESINDGGQALLYFQRVSRADPAYYDPRGAVGDRIRRLDVPHKAPARAVGAEHVSDEFDAALDELLGSKLPN